MKPTPSVLVIGNCTVDLSFSVPRFPRAGETLLAHERRVDLGGKGANQAIVARRFGARTLLAAPIGCDAEGDWAWARLQTEGLPPHGIWRTDTATDQSIIYVTPEGENSIVSSHQSAARATADWARSAVNAAPADTILVMQGNLSLSTTCAALRAARARNLRTVVNPAPIQYSYERIFPLTDVALLNEVEARELGGGDDAIAAARAIHESGVGTVIVTLGAQGAMAISRSGRERMSAPSVAAVDTVGAGDVFCGALVACLARGTSLLAALRVAVEAASLSVTRRGTLSSFPSVAEAAAILEHYSVAP